MPDPQNPQTPDFSAVPGHQIHDPSTISAAKPDTMGLGIQDIDPARLATDIGPALDHLTSHIENYTQQGRALHPVLSRLGDATRAAKELLVGGTTPKGPQEGVLNNPVTTTMSMAIPAPEAAEALTDRRRVGCVEHSFLEMTRMSPALVERVCCWPGCLGTVRGAEGAVRLLPTSRILA